MKRLRWLCITLAFALLAACGAPQPEAAPELDPNVVGGQDAAIEDYPWMGAMVSAFEGVADTVDLDAEDEAFDFVGIDDAPDENELVQFCGGSLIDENWVLSAAHCFAESGAQLSYEGADGEASVTGFADASVVEGDKLYTVPNQVAFAELEGELEFAGEVVFFESEDAADVVDTACATNEAFERSLETGQSIAIEVTFPASFEEAQALAEELGQENCSEEELEASYFNSLEGNIVEIASIVLSEEDVPEASEELLRTRRTERSAAKQADKQAKTPAGRPTLPTPSWLISLTTFVDEAPTEEDLAVAAFLEELKTEGGLNISYSPELLINDTGSVNIMFGSESVNVGGFRASGGELVEVEEILVHPRYSPISIGLSYDYALLRLERPVNRPTIALGRDKIAAGVTTSVTGWGFTEGILFDDPEDPDFPEDPDAPEEPEDPEDSPDIVNLQVADNIRTLSDAECQARAETLNGDFIIFPNPFDLIAPTILCTETFSQEEERALDACGGDSGGPLFREDEEGNTVQVGIVSFGYAENTDCGGEDGVGGYSRVSRGLGWINKAMNGYGQW